MFADLVKFKGMNKTIDSTPEKFNFSERRSTSGSIWGGGVGS